MDKKIKVIGMYRVNPALKTLKTFLEDLADRIGQKDNKAAIKQVQKLNVPKPRAALKGHVQVNKPVTPATIKRIVPSKLVSKSKRSIWAKRIVNKVVQDANAMEIVFPDLGDHDTVVPGVKAEIDSKPASGEYVMPDGRTFKFSAGKLIKIIPSEKYALAKSNKASSKAPDKVPDRGAGARKWLASKKQQPNPTATPENRFAGVPERLKELAKQKRIEDYKRKNKK